MGLIKPSEGIKFYTDVLDVSNITFDDTTNSCRIINIGFKPEIIILLDTEMNGMTLVYNSKNDIINHALFPDVAFNVDITDSYFSWGCDNKYIKDYVENPDDESELNNILSMILCNDKKYIVIAFGR